MKYLILILLSLCSYSIDLSGQIIMPTPGKIERADGRLRLQGKIRMYAEESPGSFIRLFYEKLVPESAVEWCKEEVNSHISWKKDVTLPTEGYRIRVTPERIIVEAADDAGFIYAIQSLRQWNTGEERGLIFPCV